MNGLLVLAAEMGTIEAAERSVGGILKFVLDNPFALAVTFVFLVALVGAFIAARKRDPCLKKFQGFPVTVHQQGGRRIWGRLKVFSKGLEVMYETAGGPVAPAEGPAKRSFLLYEGELAKVLAVYRFADRLGGPDLDRRRRQARRLGRPPLASRIGRWLRNIVNTFRDAITSALGLSIQQAAKTSPSAALKTQGGQVAAIGTLLVGETAHAYEPMLEQYIGRPVVLELANPADPAKRVVEYRGRLGEYSAQFILLVDVFHRFEETAPLGRGPAQVLEDRVAVRREGGDVRVENGSGVPVIVETLAAGEARQPVGRAVEPGAAATVPIEKGPAEVGTATAGPLAAILSCDRSFEVIVPRACGIVRHAGGGL